MRSAPARWLLRALFPALLVVAPLATSCAARRDIVRVQAGAARLEHGGPRSCGRIGGKLGRGATGATGADMGDRTRATEALECAARTARDMRPLEPMESTTGEVATVARAEPNGAPPAAGDDARSCTSTSQCYDGFSPSGDALADVRILGERCGSACGMAPRSKTYDIEARDDQAPLVFAIDLDAASCYRVFAVGGEGIRVLRAAIVDEGGRAVSIDNSRDRAPMLGPREAFCPSHGGHFRLVVAAERGAGRYAIQMWSRAR
jgi:hypothetical protein